MFFKTQENLGNTPIAKYSTKIKKNKDAFQYGNYRVPWFPMDIMWFFLIVFIAISVIHVVFIVLKMEKQRRISKCLVMPLLLAVYMAGGGSNFMMPILALVFGWIGDVLLIRIEKKTHFLLGLTSFLLGHLCYIVAFIQILANLGHGGAAVNINIPAMLIFVPPTVVLAMVVFRLIKPTKEMFIPVIIYMIVLVGMNLVGFQVFLVSPAIAGLLLLSGNFNFIVSDTILAYYTFRKLKLLGAVLIMVYYILAQAEIIMGILLLRPWAL